MTANDRPLVMMWVFIFAAVAVYGVETFLQRKGKK